MSRSPQRCKRRQHTKSKTKREVGMVKNISADLKKKKLRKDHQINEHINNYGPRQRHLSKIEDAENVPLRLL